MLFEKQYIKIVLLFVNIAEARHSDSDWFCQIACFLSHIYSEDFHRLRVVMPYDLVVSIKLAFCFVSSRFIQVRTIFLHVVLKNFDVMSQAILCCFLSLVELSVHVYVKDLVDRRGYSHHVIWMRAVLGFVLTFRHLYRSYQVVLVFFREEMIM